MSGSPSRSALAEHRAVGDDVGHVGAGVAQLLGEHARGRCRRAAAESACPRRSPVPLQRFGQRVGAELRRRRDRHGCRSAAAARRSTARRCTAGRPAGRARRRAASSRCHEVVDRVGAREDDPVEVPASRARAVERRRILRRRDPDRRRRDRFGAALLEHVDQLACLLARSRDEDAPPEQRPVVEPAQMLAQPGHRADDQQRRPSIESARVGDAFRACRRPCRCVGSVAVVDERRRFVGRAAVREQRRRDRAAICCAPGVADDRAVEPREAAQSTSAARRPTRPRGRGRTSGRRRLRDR